MIEFQVPLLRSYGFCSLIQVIELFFILENNKEVTNQSREWLDEK